jgi:hypothetical protein
MSLWTDLATWRGPSVNHGGPMVEQRGLVIHIAQGYFEGTIAYENHANPSSASSHFVCGDGVKDQGRDGELAQLLDTDTTAYTQQAGNGHWVSVECAGFVPGALTPAQCESVAHLFARGHRQYGWPLQLANGSTGRGLGHHSMGGAAWGHLDCPGPAIIAQKPAILARAIQIVNGAPNGVTDMPVVAHCRENGGYYSYPVPKWFKTEGAVTAGLAAYGMTRAQVVEFATLDAIRDALGPIPGVDLPVDGHGNVVAAAAGGLVPHEHVVPASTTGPAVEA